MAVPAALVRTLQSCRGAATFGFMKKQRPQARCVPVLCTKLIFNDYGDPNEMIVKVEEELDATLSGNQVLVKMLAAPLNPADITTVQGKYAIKPPSFPAVVGNEGLGEVMAVGDDVKEMEPGDWVIPFLNLFGTCRSHVLTTEDEMIKIRNTLPMVEAATLSVNPCTAYRMLNDFVRLDDGDVVIQNGANSAVGQAVIQLSRNYGFSSVNIVRNRDDIDDLKAYLKKLGATEVLTEEELRTTDLFSSGRMAQPLLGLNCVGGASATELVRHLGTGGALVNYGAMAHQPLTVPIGPLIFRDLALRGFWMTRWTRLHSKARARWEMLDQLQTMCETDLFRAPRHELVHIDDYKTAVQRAMPAGGRVNAKQILVFDRKLIDS